MSHLVNRGRGRGRLGALSAAALLGASAGVVALASPASAEVCDVISVGYSDPEGLARVDFRAERDCSNHTTRVYGTLSDTSCDDRSVHLEVIYSGGHFGNNAVTHDGGCNTSVSFDFSSGDLPGTSVEVRLKAFNGWPWSQTDISSSTYYF